MPGNSFLGRYRVDRAVRDDLTFGIERLIVDNNLISPHEAAFTVYSRMPQVLSYV